MTTVGAPGSPSRQFETSNTSTRYPVIPTYWATGKQQQDSSSRPRVSVRESDCFQPRRSVGSPSKRLSGTPKSKSRVNAGTRPYRAARPKSVMQPSQIRDRVRDKQQVPGPKVHRAGYMGGERPEIYSGQPTPSTKRTITGVPPGSTRYSIFPKPTQQQTLPDTEMQFFPIPSELGKGSESAAADMSTLSSTPTVTGTPAFVHTAHELPPYQQQYQQAELAITSVDQKATRKGRKPFQLQFRKPSDRYPGALPTQATTAPRKESNTSAAIPLPICGSLPQISDMEFPQCDRKQDLGGRLVRWAVSRVTEKPSQSFGEPIESVQPLASKRNAMKLRPSAVFRTTKPLPALPQSPRPPASAEDERDVSVFSSGIENGRPDGRPQDHRRRARPSFALSATSMGKREKAMATLRMVLTSPRARHAVAIPARKASVATPRRRPPVITEDDEPSPEKSEMHGHMPSGRHCNDTHVDMGPQGNHNSSRRAIINTVVPESVETSTHVISTSFPSEAPLNGVVSTFKTPQPGSRGAHPRRSATSKLSSPSQRLRRAVIMRRQRIAEAAKHDLGASEQPVVSGTVSAPTSLLGADTSSWGLSEAGERDAEKHPLEHDEDISDRDVLRGLRIVCAASADAEFDTFVWSKTGVRLRRFLADLQSFEELGPATMGGKTAILKSPVGANNIEGQ